MFVSEWFHKLSHLSMMLMSVYSINSRYQGLKGPPYTNYRWKYKFQNISLEHWAAQMHFFLTEICQKRLKIIVHFPESYHHQSILFLCPVSKASESTTMLQRIIRSSNGGLMSQAAVIMFYDFAYIWKICNCIMTLKCPRAAWPSKFTLADTSRILL